MIENETYNNYFNNLIKGAKNECVATLDELLNKNVPVEKIYAQLFQRSLYQVGEYWEMNKISVATEHMATAITENLMIRVQPQLFSTERTGKKAVIACVANSIIKLTVAGNGEIIKANAFAEKLAGRTLGATHIKDFFSDFNARLDIEKFLQDEITKKSC